MDVIVIDDEAIARQRMVNLCKSVSSMNVVKECSKGEEAIREINHYRPDLIFLDIRMKDISGFDVLKEINQAPKPIIVFVTAFDEYALQAFEFNAFDFLLKPFKDERFHQMLEKVKNLTQNEIDLAFEKKLHKLFELNVQGKCSKLPIKQKGKIVLIELDEIRYICADGYYAEIFTDRKKYVIRETLNNLSELLNENIFHRVHRSTIVNIDFIQEIVSSDFAEIDVKMKDNELFRVSKSHKKDFLQKIGI